MDTYKTYKDSMIDWIGKVPYHWKKYRLKFLFSKSISGVWGDEEKGNRNDIICFRIADFDYLKGYLKFEDLTIRNISQKDLNERMLHKGDLLIEKSGGGDSTPVGRVVRYNYGENATCSNFIHFITVRKNICSDFMYYYFYAMYANKVNTLYFNQTTGIQNLKIGRYLSQVIYVPILEEQVKIATYLNNNSKLINKSIKKLNDRIKLLLELRHVIIVNTVTKGIKNDVVLKNSGVNWIGDIPEHWNVAPLKRYTSIYTGSTPSTKKDEYYSSEDIEWFTPGDFNSNCLSSSNRKISEKAKKDNQCKVFPKESIYLIGIGSTIGKVAFCKEEASANQQINVIVPNKNIFYKFIYYCLLSQKDEIILYANTVTLPIINQQKTGHLQIPIPPMEEQMSIVYFLDKKYAEIEKEINVSLQKINLLQELKQSIVTEAVTGKIKIFE